MIRKEQEKMTELEKKEKDDTGKADQNAPKFKRFKDKRKKEKYVPTFKKKVPTWKQIETEISDILPQYENVNQILI